MFLLSRDTSKHNGKEASWEVGPAWAEAHGPYPVELSVRREEAEQWVTMKTALWVTEVFAQLLTGNILKNR